MAKPRRRRRPRLIELGRPESNLSDVIESGRCAESARAPFQTRIHLTESPRQSPSPFNSFLLAHIKNPLAISPPESSLNHPFQCKRIPHRIAAAVVVKVDEHVPTHDLPLSNAVGPPAHIIMAV